MIDRVGQLADEIEKQVIGYRRDFHRHAESGWTEFRTASLVARRLANLGYEVEAGRQVVKDEERMGLPDPASLEEHWLRAEAQGGDLEMLSVLKGGFTGVVGTLRRGQGPCVGLRFDMDAVEVLESSSSEHRPAREGFSSVNSGVMHACGHDGHTAVGLGIAEVLMSMREEVYGTVKLVFQPAEEGVRGARAMVAAGVVDGVDYLLGHHLYSGWDVGDLDPGRSGYLSTTKFDAVFSGAPAHAGGKPHEGKNALLAAATAVLNLHALPRHKEGPTRVNVGRLTAGTGRNVVCPTAHLVLETRGASTELNEYVYCYAVRVLEAAAQMHECSLDIRAMGSAETASSDAELTEQVKAVAQEIGEFSLRAPEEGGGSEDITYMMRRVQEDGGLAANIGLGADLGGWGHHTGEFDFDEGVLKAAIRLLANCTLRLLKK